MNIEAQVNNIMPKKYDRKKRMLREFAGTTKHQKSLLHCYLLQKVFGACGVVPASFAVATARTSARWSYKSGTSLVKERTNRFPPCKVPNNSFNPFASQQDETCQMHFVVLCCFTHIITQISGAFGGCCFY